MSTVTFLKILAVCALLVFICNSAPAHAGVPPTTQSSYKLVWSDEFDKGSVPDPATGTCEAGYIRNNELQSYTNRHENVRVENGCLVLEARKELLADGSNAKTGYTSGSIESLHKASWTYGRFEARIKFPTARGTWPAFWMMGDDIPQVGWPKCGEIDIMENVGFEPDLIHGSIHWAANGHSSKTQTYPVKNAADDFHIYGVDWSAERITFSVDHHDYFTATNPHGVPIDWPFDHSMFLKLNFAIGGDWGGLKGLDEAAFPQRMLVDYVRVYGASKNP